MGSFSHLGSDGTIDSVPFRDPPPRTRRSHPPWTKTTYSPNLHILGTAEQNNKHCVFIFIPFSKQSKHMYISERKPVNAHQTTLPAWKITKTPPMRQEQAIPLTQPLIYNAPVSIQMTEKQGLVKQYGVKEWHLRTILDMPQDENLFFFHSSSEELVNDR